MITFFVPKITNRIKYIFNYIFSSLSIIEYELIDNYDAFKKNNNSHKIVYDKHPHDDYPFLYLKDIMINSDIIEVPFLSSEYNGYKTIFAHSYSKSILPFDPFAASFYMISRYEEYLMHTRDEHQRYHYSNSIAFKDDFINLPIVNIWADMLETKLRSIFPDLSFSHPNFHFLPTIDVDQAFEHKNKGFVRTTGSLIKALFKETQFLFFEKLAVIWKLKKDPFDTFEHILNIKNDYNLDMIFFFLISSQRKFDNGNFEYNKNFRRLIRHVYDYSNIGIHPSYFSAFEHTDLIGKEKEKLEEIVKIKINKSRQHFLRFEIPVTYQKLLEYDITEDYSMAYADNTGFRAGVCTPFYFFDLEDNEKTKLKIFPVSVMDVTLIRSLGLSYADALSKIKDIITVIKNYNGYFIPLWHNSSFAEKGLWKNLFKEIVQYLSYIE